MPRKIDKIEYPDEVLAMLNSKLIGPVFKKFLDASRASENYQFLLDAQRKIPPNKLYMIYLEKNAPVYVNLPSKLHAQADELAASEQWKHKDWAQIQKDAAAVVYKLLKQNSVDSFFRSKQFAAIHEMYVKKKGGAGKGAASPKDLDKQIDVNIKKLRVCGFEFGEDKALDKKVLEKTNDMLMAFLQEKVSQAQADWKFIKSVQPKGSKLATMNLQSILKLLAKYRVLNLKKA